MVAMHLSYQISPARKNCHAQGPDAAHCRLPEFAGIVKYPVPRESRAGWYFLSEAVAQLVEQQTFNLWVLGSIPSGLMFSGVTQTPW